MWPRSGFRVNSGPSGGEAFAGPGGRSRMYRSRSCSATRGPARTRSTRARCGSHPSGRVAAPPRRRRPGRLGECASSAARSAITFDCGDASAPSCEPYGREWKYASESPGAIRVTDPRRAPGAAMGAKAVPPRPRVGLELVTLAGLVVRVERHPRLVDALEQHDAYGRSTVGRRRGERHRIGLVDPRVTASSSQRPNSRIGSSPASDSSSPSRAYVSRIRAKSGDSMNPR